MFYIFESVYKDVSTVYIVGYLKVVTSAGSYFFLEKEKNVYGL